MGGKYPQPATRRGHSDSLLGECLTCRVEHALIVGFATAALLAGSSQAIIIDPTSDPLDNPDVFSQVAHDPRVEVLRREANTFRKRITTWKERDFLLGSEKTYHDQPPRQTA
jgi:hypothetical protein